ncbi:MAG: HEPN domain-containing protein [Candidatus Gastranaerophilaceae bacterium]
MREVDRELLVSRAFEKSDEAMQTAKLNLDNDLLSSAQNRIYYGIFYAVNALAYKYGFITSKHGQLLSWFNKKFIHEDKIFDKELFKIYKYNFDNRQKSDYDFIYQPVKEDVELSYQDGIYFIDIIKQYLLK